MLMRFELTRKVHGDVIAKPLWFDMLRKVVGMRVSIPNSDHYGKVIKVEPGEDSAVLTVQVEE